MQKEITQVISRDENTPELAQFWGYKYFEILEKKLFVLDTRYEKILTSNGENVGLVPAGHLLLCNHLDKDKRLDEDLLVSTIETSIRLLDALVTYLWKQKNIVDVSKKRVISLGVDDMDDFFEQFNKDATDDDKEYIAQLVGETAYRASEFIAEEKGPFDEYDKIKYDIGENYFDAWVDEKDTIKSNQEIQSLKNEVQAGQYCLLPRRNLGILNFVIEKKWKKYSDEDIISQAAKDLDKSFFNGETSKPFNITLSTPKSSLENNRETKNRVNNHVDEIFEHLLKEREESESRLVQPLKPAPAIDQGIVNADIHSKGKEILLYILITHNDKFVFAKDNNRLTLPFVSLDNESNIEKAIWEGVLKKYNLLINLDKEFTVLYDPLSDNSVIKIGYIADIQNHALPVDMFWASPENGDFIDGVSFKLLEKYKQSNKEKTTKHIDTIEKISIEPTPQRSVQIPNSTNQPEQIKNNNAVKPDVNPKNALKTNKKPALFKKPAQEKVLYSLKLEQKIQTKTFGEICIVFEYTKKYPQIVDFRCKKLSQSDKHALDVIINLINLLLTNNYELDQIEKYLEEKVQKDENNTINNFITVFIYAMREVPSNLSELRDLLVE